MHCLYLWYCFLPSRSTSSLTGRVIVSFTNWCCWQFLTPVKSDRPLMDSFFPIGLLFMSAPSKTATIRTKKINWWDQVSHRVINGLMVIIRISVDKNMKNGNAGRKQKLKYYAMSVSWMSKRNGYGTSWYAIQYPGIYGGKKISCIFYF